MTPAVLLQAAGAVEAVAGHSEFQAFMESWHDFYLMAGTAAVTLAGLLFVALSIHLDKLVEESHEHLLALGRVTLMSFTMMLVISLFMLVPPESPRQLAIMMFGVAFAGTFFTLRMMGAARHHEEAGFSRTQMMRRTLPSIVTYLMVAISGYGLLKGAPEALFMMIGAICMALGNAAGTSWELIVHVAKTKRRESARP